VRVQQVGLDAASRAYEARQQRRDEQGEPRAPPQVAEHAVAEGQAEAAKLLRPDDLDIDAAAAHVLHGVRDEAARGVARIPRTRRREHAHAHQLWIRKTA
jgi:hypothetical protein